MSENVRRIIEAVRKDDEKSVRNALRDALKEKVVERLREVGG